jgi:hypothetical protein
MPRAVAKKDMPAIVKQHFEKGEAGYVNYFFNRQNQERLWKGLVARGDFSEFGGPWVLSGMVNANAGQFRIELTGSDGRIELPTGDTDIKVAEGLDARLNPPGSGGMLGALWLWRKYLVEGPKKFGKLEYRGEAPLPFREGLFDVLVGTAEGVECLFYFEPTSTALVLIEMFPDGSNADPCEVYFHEYEELEGRQLPRRLEVRHGDSVYGIYELTKADLHKPVEKQP